MIRTSLTKLDAHEALKQFSESADKKQVVLVPLATFESRREQLAFLRESVRLIEKNGYPATLFIVECTRLTRKHDRLFKKISKRVCQRLGQRGTAGYGFDLLGAPPSVFQALQEFLAVEAVEA